MKKLILLLWSAQMMFTTVGAQSVDSRYFDSMQWRMIGPHRGGRTVGAVGVPQQPDLSVGDGMYKSTDAGKTWKHLGLKGVKKLSFHLKGQPFSGFGIAYSQVNHYINLMIKQVEVLWSLYKAK